jgi:hypothetical protein
MCFFPSQQREALFRRKHGTRLVIPPGYLQCNAMQCNAMQCNAMQCNAMQCNAKQCNAMQCNARQCNAMQCNAMQCNAMQCNAMQCLHIEFFLLSARLVGYDALCKEDKNSVYFIKWLLVCCDKWLLTWCFKRRASHVPNAVETIDNDAFQLIIYCF